MFNVNFDTNEIILDGTVVVPDYALDEPISNEGFCFAQFAEAFQNLKGDEVTVKINSYGGNLSQAIAIYNLLRTSGKKIKTVNLSICASAGSIIFLAGDERTMLDGSFIMFHYASVPIFGNAVELQEAVDDLKKTDEKIVEIIIDRTGMSLERVTQICQDEVWIWSEKALELNIATQVEQKLQAVACSTPDKLRNSEGYKNMILNMNKVEEIKEESPTLLTVTNKIDVIDEVVFNKAVWEEMQKAEKDKVLQLENSISEKDKCLIEAKNKVNELENKVLELENFKKDIEDKANKKKTKVDSIVPEPTFANLINPLVKEIKPEKTLMQMIEEEPDAKKREILLLKNWSKLREG